MKPAAMGQAEALSRNLSAELSCARTMIGGDARSTLIVGGTVVGGSIHVAASYRFNTPEDREALIKALRELLDQLA